MKKKIEECNIPKFKLGYLQHNPKHYLTLSLLNHIYYPCARCFGLLLGLLVGFILTFPFWLGVIYTYDFVLIFVIAWLFVIPSIVDWSTVKLGLRSSNNVIRVATGFLQGMGTMIYLFVLPADILFKIATILFYELVFEIVQSCYHIHKGKIKKH